MWTPSTNLPLSSHCRLPDTLSYTDARRLARWWHPGTGKTQCRCEAPVTYC